MGTKVFKNIVRSLSANMVSMLVSIFILLFIPKAISVEEYGAWQLYSFYIGYVAFFQFGWTDGIYLEYGGWEYNNLNKSHFKSQICSFAIFETIISATLLVLIPLQNNQLSKFIVFFSIINILLVNFKSLLIYILQAVNRFKDYSIIVTVERISFLLLVFQSIITCQINVYSLIFYDIIGKLLALIIACYKCRELIFNISLNKIFSKNEIKKTGTYIKSGIQLLISYISGNLVIGSVRFGIQTNWGVRIFGLVSLSLSLINFIMFLINSLGIVFYPLLRRVREEHLKRIYVSSLNLLSVALYCALFLYYPLRILVQLWIPEYSDALKYLGYVFPICIFESKMLLLTNTFLKNFRKEKVLMKYNAISVVLSVVTTILTCYIFRNLSIALLSIPILSFFRYLFLTKALNKIFNIRTVKVITLDCLIVLVFLISIINSKVWFIYVIMVAVVFIAQKNTLILSIKTLRNSKEAFDCR